LEIGKAGRARSGARRPAFSEGPLRLFPWQLTNQQGRTGGLAGAFEERKKKMNWLANRVLQLQVWRDTSGQDLVEYALAAGMVAVAAVACMPALSTTVSDVFTKIGGIINNNVH